MGRQGDIFIKLFSLSPHLPLSLSLLLSAKCQLRTNRHELTIDSQPVTTSQRNARGGGVLAALARFWQQP